VFDDSVSLVMHMKFDKDTSLKFTVKMKGCEHVKLLLWNKHWVNLVEISIAFFAQLNYLDQYLMAVSLLFRMDKKIAKYKRESRSSSTARSLACGGRFSNKALIIHSFSARLQEEL
jgi:hypothetical protein